MSEEKMREEFERWAQSPNGSYLDAESAWKACAAIKDAEIANLVHALTLNGITIEQQRKEIASINDEAIKAKNYMVALSKTVTEQGVEIASQALMINELREAILATLDNLHVSYDVDALLRQALANSEHHNSRKTR